MKKTPIFDDGATVIEHGTPKKKATDQSKSTKETYTYAKIDKDVNVSDILSSVFAYLPPRANIMETSEEVGRCVLCGKGTSNPMRSICYDCICNHGKELYEKSRDAVKNGEKKIKME